MVAITNKAKIKFKQMRRQLMFTALMFLFMLPCATAQSNTSFPIFKNGKVASIYVSETEAPQVIRAVGDLQNDIKMVTGIKPNVIHELNNAGDYLIIITSVDNPHMKKLLNGKKLDEAKGMSKMFESFLIKTIDKPAANVEKALTVIGSDAMGAVFGLYEISKRVGVSPLYWWCDVTPEKQSEIIIEDFYSLPKEPSVKYRGVFINDEEALTQWSKRSSIDKDNGHPSPEVYKRIFELLLRLKANAIWPAMMNASSYFFEFKDGKGVSLNAKNASEYGIYIGTSHCENMARNNFTEWHPWADANANKYDAKGVPVFDYTVNPKAIEAYWQQRLDETKDLKTIYTIGIRGVSDSGFMMRNIEDHSLENKVALLQKVINRQREMIKETFGSEDAVPQIFVPYEETGELYNGESKDGSEQCEGVKIPDDVTIVWTEDNYGFTRQLPSESESKRSGGNGLYYHIAYQGGNTYDWLTATPIPLMQEQLTKAYNAGSKNFWIVNVGDVKPAEMGLQFYMGLAYDINSYPNGTSKEFLKKHAKQNFGVQDETAVKVADIMTEYHQLTSPQKAEFMTPFWSWDWTKDRNHQFYSLFDFGDEAQIRIEDYTKLEESAKQIYDQLPLGRKDPFWHLVYYPIRSTRLMLEKTTYYRKNLAYEIQGRFASVAAYEGLSRKAESEIQKDIIEYNEIIQAGKWNGIMDPYAFYNMDERVFDAANIPNNFVYKKKFQEEAVKGIGSVCEGQRTGEEVVLQFSSFEDNIRFIDVFNRESQENEWAVESTADWLKISKISGMVLAEERVWIHVDWAKLSEGVHKAEITIKGAGDYIKKYPVSATKYDLDLKDKSFVEGNGFVSIEAEHYTVSKPGKNNSSWNKYDNYGYVGSSMFVKGGDKVEENHQTESARLEYSVYFNSTGTFYGVLYRIPTLNEGKGNTSEIAIGVNDDAPQILSGIRHKGEGKKVTLSDGTSEYLAWNRNILAQMERLPFKIEIDKPGYHTLKLYQINTDIGVDRIIICTNEQAITALKRSILASPESYNTYGTYKAQRTSTLPSFPSNILRVAPYQKQKPLKDVKFNFMMYGTPDAHGWTTVHHRSVYDPITSVYGWRKSDIPHINEKHNESTIGHPYWQRDYFWGEKEARFYVHLKQGSYRLVLHFGDVSNIDRNIYYYIGKDFDMSLSINGQQFMDNEYIKIGDPFSRTMEIEIGAEEMLELVFTGRWTITALEIIPN